MERQTSKQSRHSGIRRASGVLVALGLMLLPVFAGGGEPTAKPQRIASICLQGDQLLLQLVPRERIIALSALATDPDISAHWEAARGIPVTQGGAEELLRLKPDLVLVSENARVLTVAILKRLGVPVLALGFPTDFEGLRQQLLQTGRSLGEEARAQEIVQDMDTRLARLKARRDGMVAHPTALFYFQDGFTPGAHTFADAILELAGLRNLASDPGFPAGISTSAESVLLARPQYLILTRYREASPTFTQRPEMRFFHPLENETKILTVSFRHLSQPDLSNLELAETLQEALCR